MPASLSDLISPRKKVTFSRVAVSGQIVETITLDVSTDENHDSSSDVTDYPVEQGPNIADNSRPRPRTLSITGAITGSPIDLGEAYAMPPAIKAQRGKNAWERLDAWQRDGERLRVNTSFYSYVDMVIQSITVPRDASNTDGVAMTINLKQVFTVQSKTVQKPTRATQQPKTDQGKKSTSLAKQPPADAAKGILKTGADLVTNLFED